MLVESVKFKKKHSLIPIDTVMKDGEPRSNKQIISAVIDLPTHGGRIRRIIPTTQEVAMYVKNNPKYEKVNEKGDEKIWKMKI